jgi:UDP-GlcNAc:undecaprenyl-phosphate GlcNAc-1-phosphate transferase
MPFNSTNWLPIALAFGLALGLTPMVRAFAIRRGYVAHPRSDRWHQRPIALLGGVAIFLSVAIVLLIFDREPPRIGWVLGALIMFATGLVDDLVRMRPRHKLLAQIVAAAVVLWSGERLHAVNVAWIDVGISSLWLIGITNALNLLDNMDGLTAGVGGIAAAFFAANFTQHGDLESATRFAVLSAGLAGFLVYNFRPASIFMGDGGALFVGFFLACAPLSSGPSQDPNPVTALLVPALILAVPIFDTCFVTMTRILAGVPISQGGRDHTSHRLAAAGLSDAQVAVVVCGVSAVLGVLAVNLDRLARDVATAVAAAVALGFLCVGVWLKRVGATRH